MKKKILCLLLALVVVISVVPLTAFAATVPEEFRGKWREQDPSDPDKFKEIIVTENQATLYDSFMDIRRTFSLSYLSDTQCIFESTGSNGLEIWKCDSNSYKVQCQLLNGDGTVGYYFNSYNFVKQSDSTNSTLSTGSELIIPVAAGVVLIGAVIFIGKRKKEKTE